MARLTIDGRSLECGDSTTVLAAARSIGIDIPTLCHDDRLEPTGACRLCLVEVDGSRRPVPACSAPVHDGMTVHTVSPALAAARRMMLEMLAEHHPPGVLPDAAAKPFDRLLEQHGIAPGGPASDGLVDDTHPYIRVDMSRCIDCFRCVRICDDVQGQHVWHVLDRGSETVIHPAGGTLGSSPCVACGACVDTCPTGALEDRGVLEHGAATVWTRSVCPYCGVGCELEYGSREGRMVAARPVMDAPVNHGHACVKGRYAFDFVHAPDRVTTPLLRESGRWRPASWQQAIEVAAAGLRRAIDRHGPDAVGVLGSARATNEENYLTQKLARYAIGTNNVDCCARVCHAPSAAALKMMLGAGAATNGFDDIEHARTILVCGANTTESHPVIGARIRQAARRGASLIVIDPRRIELTREHGAVHLALRPGTNLALLNAMAHTIIDEGLVDAAFLEQRVDGLAEYQAAIADWTPELAEIICGVPAVEIRRAARVYANGRPSMIMHGLGVTEHVQGTDGVSALINLALLTGNIGNVGGGVNPLRGQNNVQGSAQMGCDPGTLTGGVRIDDGRARVESVWGRPLPTTPGMTLPEMMQAARDGRLKALVVVGYDVLLTNPDMAGTRKALQALDLLIVLDLFHTETSTLAHVFLPAVSSFEKEGTFMNAERRLQRVRKVIEPVGEARSDAETLSHLASALGQGAGFRARSASEIWDEVRMVWPAVRGATYERLERGGIQWPCPSDDHPGTARLYAEGFPGGRVRLRPIDYRPTLEATSPEFPVLLTSGRTLYQFNAGTMTSRTKNQELRPVDVLDLCATDAISLGVSDGDRIRVASRYGETTLPVHISDAMQTGQAFATFHTVEACLNRVTSRERDPVGTPEYKVTAVRIERVDVGAGQTA